MKKMKGQEEKGKQPESDSTQQADAHFSGLSHKRVMNLQRMRVVERPRVFMRMVP